MVAFQLDPDLPRELAPLAWLIGRWEGSGAMVYPTVDDRQFAQEIECHHDGRPFLYWTSRSWLLGEDGTKERLAAVETGFWRPLPNEEAELLLVHPMGILEMYYGTAVPAKIQLRTDGVMRSPSAKEYNAATRLYGLVESKLMWRMDMAAVGQPMQAHLSAELERVG